MSTDNVAIKDIYSIVLYEQDDEKRVMTYKNKNMLLYAESYNKGILHGNKNYYENNIITKTEIYKKGKLVCTGVYKEGKLLYTVFNDIEVVEEIIIKSNKVYAKFE